MKKILFKYLILISYVFGLSGCGYLITFGIFMLDGSCADWNCTKPTPRWEKKMERCREDNVKNLGYDIIELNKFSIGNKITSEIFDQCLQTGASYDARKDPNIQNMLMQLKHSERN